MKKLSKILSIALCLAMVLGLFTFGASAAGNTADFDTLTPNVNSYADNTTDAGWSIVKAQIATGSTSSSNANFSPIGDATAVLINGKKTAAGSITSPTLSGGIAQLSFNYANFYSENNGVDITITISQNGSVVASKQFDIANSDVTKGTAYTAAWTLDNEVSGDFIIKIVNNCPSNNTGNKDRVAIWNLTWISAGSSIPACTHPQKTYEIDNAAGTHTEKCASCGEVTGTPQNHTYANNTYGCDTCSYIKYPAADSVLTFAQATELGAAHAKNAYSTSEYIITGKIHEIVEDSKGNNLKYGNMTLIDEAGNTFYVYGVKDEAGNLYQDIPNKPVIGDTISVKGIIGKYDDPQMKNGVLVNLCDHTDFTWAADEDSHWKVCSNTDCGKIFDECTETPVPNKNDTQHWTECDCGYESTKTNHDFGTEYKIGENGHYQECECGQKTAEEDHADGTDEDELCDKCGLNMACPHTTWKENHDKDNHWLECDACEAKKDVTKHTLTTEHDKDNHWTECECGYASEEVKHTMNTKHNDKKHWTECECGEKTAEVEHKFTGLKCECGFENAVGADYAKFPISKPSDIKPGYYILGGHSVNGTDDGNTYAFMGAEADNSNRLNGIGLTGKNGTINAKEASNIWEFIAVDGGFKIKNVGTGKYLYAKDNQNKVYLTENAAEAGVWKVVALEGGWGLQDTATERCLGANRYGKEGSYYLGFAAYKVSQYVPCLLDLYTINDGSFKPAPNTGDGISAVVALLAVSGMGLVVLTAKKKED